MASPGVTEKKVSHFTLEERFEFGAFTPAEVQELAGVSNSTFYRDVQAGLVEIIKRGGASRVPGPSARAYIKGRPATAENSPVPPLRRHRLRAEAAAQ